MNIQRIAVLIEGTKPLVLFSWGRWLRRIYCECDK